VLEIGCRHTTGRLRKTPDVPGDVKADMLALTDDLWILAMNGAEAEENILTFVAADKAGTDFMIEPLDLSCWHGTASFLCYFDRFKAG
jgi:hypothetical protein